MTNLQIQEHQNLSVFWGIRSKEQQTGNTIPVLFNAHKLNHSVSKLCGDYSQLVSFQLTLMATSKLCTALAYIQLLIPTNRQPLYQNLKAMSPCTCLSASWKATSLLGSVRWGAQCPPNQPLVLIQHCLPRHSFARFGSTSAKLCATKKCIHYTHTLYNDRSESARRTGVIQTKLNQFECTYLTLLL